jgi:PAS domain S-box-containing protein
MIGGVVMKSPVKIFNTTSALVLILDEAGEIVWLNDTCEQFLGCRLADLKHTACPPFLSTSNHEKFKFVVSQVIRGGTPDPFDIPVTCSDKTKKMVRWNTMLVCDEDNPVQKCAAISGVVIAGAGRKQMDLETAEERYRLLFENTGLGMIYVSEDMTIALVNREFEKLSGYPKAMVEGKMRWTEFIANKEDLRSMLEYQRARRIDPESAPELYDVKIRNRDGDLRDIMVRVMMIPDTTYSLAALVDITERKSAEKAIRESEAKYRTLVDNMHDTLYRCDNLGNMIFASPSGARLLGYDSPGELLGKNIAEDIYFNPDKRPLFLEKLKAEGKVTNHEVILKRKDGTQVVVLTTSHFFYDQDGNILGVEGMLSDITQRKLLEEKFMKIFMTAPDCIAITRLADGRIIDINQGFEKITGWKRSEALGRTSYEINFWVDLPERDLMVSELKACGEVLHREFRFHQRDGSVRSGIYSARTLNIEGETHLVFVMQDISQRKETEKILREKEAQLRGITANIPGTIFQFYAKDNGEHGMSYVSERLTELFGIGTDRDDLFQVFVFLVHEDDRERFLASVWKAVELVEPWNFEGRFVRTPGETMWFHGMATPTRQEDRLVFDGILLNITGRKQAEDERQKLQGQLLQAQKMESIGRLAGGLAHDFNNILMGIEGAAALMLMDLNPEQRHYQKLKRIQEHVTRGANLTRQLLGFAREGKYEVRTLSINDLIRKTTQFFIETRKEIIADLQLPENINTVEADEGQIGQVLLNIFINAGYAMPGGRASLYSDIQHDIAGGRGQCV